MWWTWFFTVASSMHSWRAICVLDGPTSSSISTFSYWGGEVRRQGPVAELGACGGVSPGLASVRTALTPSVNLGVDG
jgi:hypothetical protein